jgi:hypothetical protein
MAWTRRAWIAFASTSATTVLLSGSVSGDEVRYAGGSVAIPQDTEGKLDTADPKLMHFASKKGSFDIPYEGITSIEYGQKAGRRIAVAILVSPIALLSKKRKHFLTLGYKDRDDKEQGVVLELAKDLPATLIALLEARTGKKCEYESEEARKHVHG